MPFSDNAPVAKTSMHALLHHCSTCTIYNTCSIGYHRVHMFYVYTPVFQQCILSSSKPFCKYIGYMYYFIIFLKYHLYFYFFLRYIYKLFLGEPQHESYLIRRYTKLEPLHTITSNLSS